MQRLENLTYHDLARAKRELAELSRALPPAALQRFDLLLAASSAPEDGLRYFARLREVQHASFQRLTRSTAGLRYLIAVFTHSRFLAEEILEHPQWVEQLAEAGDLLRVITAEELRDLLEAELPHGLPHPLLLARFRRRQLLRILIRDVLGFGTLAEITAELSTLADTIVEAAYARIYEHLTAEFGAPRAESGEEAKFSVLALGKLGGNELNYSSDIDLMFLYSANGETTGPEVITNKEFFKRAANQLTGLLSTYTAEGLCYRVDLRLRPDGSLGEVCISLEGARAYYSRRARDWELQMLIKARIAAGDRATGRALLDFVEPRTYATTLDFSAVEALSATRERLNEKLAARRTPRKRTKEPVTTPRVIDVKLERGGIRDIEFLVQCLQRLYGGQEPWVRHGGTLLALARLQDKGLLSGAEYGRLAAAYQFLRHLEHRLQFLDDRQTHVLPSEPEELEQIARRMPGGGGPARWLVGQLQSHFEQVIEIYERVVHSRSVPQVPVANPAQGQHASNVVRALEQRAPLIAASLATAVHHAEFRHGYRPFEHFLEKLAGDPARLERINSDPVLISHLLDLFEHSPYFAEELIRAPGLTEELALAAEAAPFEEAPRGSIPELRRWYRHSMLRIQAGSICLSHPIFDTLSRTSELADAVVKRVYEIALQDVLRSHPPSESGYAPRDQMWVVALGRLGMREFDLASDADLVFVLADSDAGELQFWTRVAERIVDRITAYTGAGTLFAVDTRLRPNGGDGPLVMTEAAYRDYFEDKAEAWEGITYMKSRAVAGDGARAEQFLHDLQAVDWRRYGQSGRSRTDLLQMRTKIEQELGAAHPLKAGRGGYYDIDFILMYLRLKTAGIFFKVLNTPARIEVLESMGNLDHADAEFLNEAASFYRALDHGIRVLTGHADSKLPATEAHIEALNALLRRWTPIPLSEVDEIRERTRTLFDRFFR